MICSFALNSAPPPFTMRHSLPPMKALTMQIPLISNELDVLCALLPPDLNADAALRTIELGCGSARMAQGLLERMPQADYLGLEIDAIQHARNLALNHPRMRFVAAGAQAIPEGDGQFDLALMLKSLHHVPLAAMDTALAEVARVLRPGGFFYISEPVYAGAMNDIVRLYNDEGLVRAAAQDAIERALACAHSPWREVARRRFDMPVHFADFTEYAQRMLYPTFANHHITPELSAKVAAAFAPHCGPGGAHFTRPMLVRFLQKKE